ncbi:MAG: ribonuclease HI [Chitinophagia bacterium]|nr:ribonuclease HI [Chitinophagia bacterium]
MQQLHIYTDGSSRGNPGPGGYGAILKWGDTEKEIAQGYKLTTNNRMELMAVIAALRLLTRTGLNIVVFSDSKYVVDAIQKRWLQGWIKKGYANVKNPDLWQQFYALYKLHHITMQWVKGHADNAYNNRCDQLATQAALSNALIEDTGYGAGAQGGKQATSLLT